MFICNKSTTWLSCHDDALMDGGGSGVGNTEREEVVKNNDGFDEDEDTETEVVAVERTEDPVAEAEELVEETDELPVVAVAVEEVDVAETLHISSSVTNKISTSTRQKSSAAAKLVLQYKKGWMLT